MSPIALGTLDEAIVNTSIAFDRMLSTPASAAQLGELVRRIEYRISAKPGGSVAHQHLTLEVAPPLGLTGRLSSMDIGTLLANALTASTASNRDAPDSTR